MTTAIRAAVPVPSGTPKGLLRRPTTVRKRENDDAPEASSPSKRSKVSFDSDVEVRVVEEREKAPAVIQEEVQRSIQKHLAGDDTSYNRIKAIYDAGEDGEDGTSSTTVRNYTVALLANVSTLDNNCSDLINAVLNSDWLRRSDEYVRLFTKLLANLVSAQGLYLVDVLRVLVENLTNDPPSKVRSHGLQSVSRSRVFKRVHEVLQFLLHVIPSASHILATIITTVFPHHTDTRRAHLVYVYNLLQITHYAQVLKSDILALITERLVKIDVQVQEDLEDLTEDVDDGVVGTISREKSKIANILDESEDSDDESDVDEDEDEDVEAQRTMILTKNVEKMDSILDMLFQYYDQALSIAPTNNQSSAMDILLSQFQTIILPAYRSRHTQFLLFHFVQKSAVYIDTFVGLCAQTSFDKQRPAMVRQTAAAYLASFVARGIHVPSSIVQDVWDYISTELKTLHKQQEPTCRGPNPTRYASYYSLVQALLYIFCFRWRDLQVDPDEVFDDSDLPSLYSEERRWRPGVKETLQLHLFSKLNPLKLCSPAIVNEFARITHHLSVIYVFHVLETNKRIRLSNFSSTQGYSQINRETALSARRDEYQHLAEYFPFDPYHLPQSKRWIEADYRDWKGVPGLDGEEPVDSDSDGEEQDKSDFEEGTETDEADD